MKKYIYIYIYVSCETHYMKPEIPLLRMGSHSPSKARVLASLGYRYTFSLNISIGDYLKLYAELGQLPIA